MSPGNRLRRHPREPIAARVRISWVPPGGATQYVIGNALDISESGMRIKSAEALPVGQYVHFQLDGVQFRGPASVRSCTRSTAKHEIGLEFSNGVKWKPVSPPPSPEPSKPAA